MWVQHCNGDIFDFTRRVIGKATKSGLASKVSSDFCTTIVHENYRDNAADPNVPYPVRRWPVSYS